MDAPPAPQKRIVSTADRHPCAAIAAAATLYALSIAVLLTSHMGRGWPFVDLSVYRQGGQAVLAGAHLYDLRFPGALAFTYPPISALAFTVLTPFSMALLEPVVTAISLILLPLALALALRLPPARTWLSRARAAQLALACSGAAIWLEPVWTSLRYGQIDLIVTVLVLFDLALAPRRRWQGAAIGLAAGLKLTPAIFAVYLLLTRRTRAAALAVLTFCATVAVGFAALPGDARAFWGADFLDPSRVGRAENAANQSLRGAYVRILHTLAVAPAWTIATGMIGALGLALAAVAGRRGDDVQGYSLCALSALLVSPVSWSHHWTLAVPALLLLAVWAARARSLVAGAAAAAIAATGFAHVTWWVPINHPLHSELHLDGLQLLCADAYVFVGLMALALAARSALRRRARERACGPPAALAPIPTGPAGAAPALTSR